MGVSDELRPSAIKRGAARSYGLRHHERAQSNPADGPPAVGLANPADRGAKRPRQEAVYHGQDRRGLIASDRSTSRRSFLAGGSTLLATVAVVLATLTVDAGADRAGLIASQLDAAALLLALLLSALCLARWRLVGEAALLWLAAGISSYGVSVLGAGYVLSSSFRAHDGQVVPILVAGTVAALIASWAAVLWHEVDTGLTPWKVAWRSVAITGVVASVVLAVPPLGGALALTATLAWALVAVHAVWRGLRRRRPLLAWAGLLFFSLAFAELFVNLAVAAGPLAELAPAILRASGMLVALTGGAVDLARIYRQQGSQLLESKAAALTTEAQLQAGLADQAERAHDALNALAAIEAATTTLQRYRDRLEESDREELSRSVSAEVHRLQQLVAPAPERLARGRFRVSEALAALVTCARYQGTSVAMDVPGHLVAIGNPAETAQVLQNLLQNAHRYAGGSVAVRARLVGDEVEILVEDDGPGIPGSERELIFERGVRGSTCGTAAGSGLGLYVSSRLMRDQGGDLRLEERSGGGARFVVSLPGFSELMDELDEQVTENLALVAGRKFHLVTMRSDPRDVTGTTESDEHVRREVFG
jgi:signal transduction histidine kinase